MRKIRPRAIRRNIYPTDPLPLLAWADARDRRFPLPVRIVAARHSLTLATAATICHLAGIGQGGDR